MPPALSPGTTPTTAWRGLAFAILGSLLIAGIDTLVQATMADGASYRLVFSFLLVILVLVLKPSGILGKPIMVKV